MATTGIWHIQDKDFPLESFIKFIVHKIQLLQRERCRQDGQSKLSFGKTFMSGNVIIVIHCYYVMHDALAWLGPKTRLEFELMLMLLQLAIGRTGEVARREEAAAL